jgi:hypothetical protein
MLCHDGAKDRLRLDQAIAVNHAGQLGGARMNVRKQLLKYRRSAGIGHGIQHLLAGPTQADGLVSGAFRQVAGEPRKQLIYL